MPSKDFDYIVIGAGSAGCAIAARLSEDPAVRVLLLEAGGPAHGWDVRIQMPAAMALPARSPRLNWGYTTEPQPQLAGRSIPWPRGRVMGGSSTINGMAFVRGHPLDFDGWATDPDLRDWDYASVLPYFKRLEAHDRGANDYRGGSGPVQVTTGRCWSPLHRAFIEAGAQAGYARTDDLNGRRPEGFGPMDMTVHRGRRVNAADAYIGPALGRKNLKVITGAHVARLLLDGRRCRGVVYALGSDRREVLADREVVLAAGAIGSPQLLLHSGIGPADELRSVGVEPRHHLPGVGRNLQDHLEVFVQVACTQPITLMPTSKNAVRPRIGVRWLLSRTGWGATNHMEAGGFIRSSGDVPYPDIQYHFTPRAVNWENAPEVHGYQAHVATMRSKARGWLRLRSNRHTDLPLIDPCYMSHPDDWTEFRAAIRLTREIFAQHAFDPYRGRELAPGDGRKTDRQLDEFVRSTATTGYHPCGTCKMGSGADAVVDGQLRVHGLEGLRVADSSIMTCITTGNLNAPSIMIGEVAGDLLRGRRLAPLHAGFEADPYRPFCDEALCKADTSAAADFAAE